MTIIRNKWRGHAEVSKRRCLSFDENHGSIGLEVDEIEYDGSRTSEAYHIEQEMIESECFLVFVTGRRLCNVIKYVVDVCTRIVYGMGHV